MEILKKGDLSRLQKKLKFTCEKCGCEFVATDDEYKYADFIESAHDNIRAKCECPECKRMVYLYD